MDKKFFFRGLKSQYDPSVHSKGIFVATDDKLIIAGGVEIGISIEQLNGLLEFMASKGMANGLATLDENGKIPASQLNGQLASVQGIDDVVTSTSLPDTSSISSGYMVWCTDDSKLREWDGSSWQVIEPKGDTIYNFRNKDVNGNTERTNIIYRWDGATMVEISSSIALGETAGTAYEGSKGKALADHLDTLQSDVTYLADTVIPQMNENTANALEYKVDWDQQKKVISLPKDGSISAMRGDPVEGTIPEGGNLLAQRTYDGGTTYVTEVGTTKNKLTLNATERPQIDLAGGISEKVAYESEIKLVPSVVNIPIRSLKDQIYDQQTILGWFGVESIADLKEIISNKGIQYLKYGISLSYNPHYYKMPIEYVAFESANQIKLVLVGLDTSNDVPSKYEIIINLDGTIVEGNSNVKLTITPIGTSSEDIAAQIQAIITQELGEETMKVISQKVVSQYINQIVSSLETVITAVGTPSSGDIEGTGIYKIIDDVESKLQQNITEVDNKIEGLVGETSVADQIQQAIDELKGGVSTEYDTLKKIEDLIKQGDANTLSSANQYTDDALTWYDVE